MEIDARCKDLLTSTEFKANLVKRDGSMTSCQKTVMTEHRLDVYINDILSMKLMCLPEHLTELVLGRMLTEGIIKSGADVKSIYICEHGKWARVMLNYDIPNSKKESFIQYGNNFVEVTQSCCTENHNLNDLFVYRGMPKPVKSIDVSQADIFFMADYFSCDMPLHKVTGASHSCFLYGKGKILFVCEDIGRHNAIDKVIGYALRKDIALPECMLYTSGRLTSEMVLKAVKARVPVLVSKAAASLDAIKIASLFNLRLICNARRDSYIDVSDTRS